MKAHLLVGLMIFCGGCAALNIRIVRPLTEEEMREYAAAHEARIAAFRTEVASLLSTPAPKMEFEERLRAKRATFSFDQPSQRSQATIAIPESGGSFIIVSYRVDDSGSVVSASSVEGIISADPATPRPELRDWKVQR